MTGSGYNSPGIYYLYGQTIRSVWPLPYLSQAATDSVEYELLPDDGSFRTGQMEAIIKKLDKKNWFQYVPLTDGTIFLRWRGLFDFLVSADGRRIVGRSFLDHPHERFQAYLLNQVLSFAMVRQGIEPLHATVVVIDGRAVAFLGDSGYGKSTLAGAFLRAGYPILTDDMLIIETNNGQYLAHPGPPRIKLFPEMAKALLSGEVAGTAMNPDTTKLIIPLSDQDVARSPVAIKMFYALQAPDTNSRQVTISRLTQGHSLLAFVQNTFNTVLKGPERLAQQFNWAAELSANLPVKSLSYPRELSFLPKVLGAVLQDNA